MSERMNKERAKQEIINHKEYCEKVLDSAVKRYTQLVGDYDNVEKIAELIQALDIAIESLEQEEIKDPEDLYLGLDIAIKILEKQRDKVEPYERKE